MIEVWIKYLVFLFGLYHVIVWLYRFSCFVKYINKIDGPRVGNQFWLGTTYFTQGHSSIETSNKYFEFLNGLSELYRNKKFFRVWIGPRPCIIIPNVDSAQEVFSSTTIIKKSIFYEFLKPWLGEGLLLSNGKKWSSRRFYFGFLHRKLLTPAFHFNILEEFLPIMNEQANVLVQTIQSQISNQNTLDVVPLFINCTLDIIAETAMGVQIRSQQNENQEYTLAITNASTAFIHRLLSPASWNSFIYFNFIEEGRNFAKDLKTLHSFVMNVIHTKKNEILTKQKYSGSKSIDTETSMNRKLRLSFMDTLMEEHLKNPKEFTLSDIREEVATFMFEGHDTTAMSLIWTAFLIGQYPKVQERIQKEIDLIYEEEFGELETSEIHWKSSHLKKMKFLEACIKESLRLFPSVPYIGRFTEEDVTINGYLIPKSTNVQLHLYSILRDPKYFSKPNHFIPDRFTENSELYKKTNSFAFVPFSAGSRNCIGQKFALQEEKLILATLFRSFTIESVERYSSVAISPEIVLRPKNPINIKFKPRFKSEASFVF